MSCTLYSGSAPDCGRNAVKGVTYWRRATRRWSGAALVVACLRRRNCQASRREFVGRRSADPPATCGQLRHVGSWYATAPDSVRAAGCEVFGTVRMGAAPLGRRTTGASRAQDVGCRSGRTNMTSTTKRRLAFGIGAALAAGVALGTLAISAAAANSAPAGITVPGDSTAAPATLVASLEGRNEVTTGPPQAQALELIGIRGNTLSYSVSWRGIGTPTEADIHAGARGVDGPVVVPLFTTPRHGDGFASGTVTVTDPTVLDALRANPSG